jgi:hypothetical protein
LEIAQRGWTFRPDITWGKDQSNFFLVGRPDGIASISFVRDVRLPANSERRVGLISCYEARVDSAQQFTGSIVGTM